MFFQVSDFIATLSDGNSKLSWGNFSKFYCSNGEYKFNPLPLKYVWAENSISEFQSAFQIKEIQNKISEFMNMSIVDTDDSVNHLNHIITDAADISLKTPNIKMDKNKHHLKRILEKQKVI